MPDIFGQISTILTQPYGSMAYHLVVSFVYIGVLYPALAFSSENKRSRSRMLAGIFGLLASQIVIFVLSALALIGFSELNSILPILDRVVITIDLIIIIWLYAYINNTDRRIDFGMIGVVAFIILGGLVTIISWFGSDQSAGFIQSDLALSWNIAVIIISAFGQLAISRSQSQNRTWGRIMLMVIMVGEFINLIPGQGIVGDYSVIIRLTYLIALPLLYGVVGGLQSEVTYTKMIITSIPDSVQATEEEPQDKVEELELIPVDTETPPEPVRGIDLHLFQNTMSLAGATSLRDISHLFTRYTAHALVSDICLLLTPPDEAGQVHLISAYDLIVQDSFSPFAFDHTLIPGYAEALDNNQFLQVTDEVSSKITTFANMIQVERINNMLIYPIVGAEGNAMAAVCLVSPYSNYTWTDKERSYLIESSSAIAAVLERSLSPKPEQNQPALQELTEQLESVENERKQLVEEKDALSAELVALSILAEEQPAELEKNKELTEQLSSIQAALEVLESENAELKENLSALSDTNNELQQQIVQLESEVTASPDELEELSKKLQEAVQRATSFENQLSDTKEQLALIDDPPAQSNGNTLPTEQAEVIASIAQELRQPMSSISGYTDLLISESVGILGALQKKFLERVKASTDRMNHLIGDLIQITTLDSGKMALTAQPVEVVEIVDTAIENTSGQFREKDIILRVDISPELPKMQTDKDALQQILLHLLQNAGAATPDESEIHVKVEPYNKADNDIILIAVSDTGEGIPKDDLPRVFSRLYRADNPLITGVGDTGVGLSIAKTLTEALGGRIWVESDQGIGSTFSVLLPVTTQTVDLAQG
jgi:signal transduction histidine kinase